MPRPFRPSLERVRAAHGRDRDGVEDLVALAVERRFGAEFQPIVELRSGNVVAHEALSRFHDAAGAPMSTGAVFTRLHAAPALLLEVELETKRLQLDHAPPGTLHVNVDPDSFAAAEDGGDGLVRLLSGAVSPVVVEVIENMSVSDAGHGGAMVRALDRAGIAIALDDVGAPNALLSLEALKLARVVKLDRSWLRRVVDPVERAILDALVALAHRLGARTVLEGVECAEDLALARELDVDCAQGFLFRDRFVVVDSAGQVARGAPLRRTTPRR
jgi:EAL domain-containing protein (putative c-di-GMP-specific phosphodiesterase class I)